LDDALILSHRANPHGWNFRERQGSGTGPDTWRTMPTRQTSSVSYFLTTRPCCRVLLIYCDSGWCKPTLVARYGDRGPHRV